MRIIALSLAFLMMLCCKSKPVEPIAANVKDTTHFFQVSQFIQAQISEVNKTPFYIYKKTIENGKTDSTAITNQQFGELAKHFLEPDINNPSLKKHYEETGFYDETTRNYTLNYSTKNKDLEIQNIDVLLLDDGQTLKRIFMRKFFSYAGDSTAIEQLSWSPDQRFQVARMVQKPNQEEISRQTTVVWNDNK